MDVIPDFFIHRLLCGDSLGDKTELVFSTWGGGWRVQRLLMSIWIYCQVLV